MPLRRRTAPFDGPEWIFELKYDGFRALAVVHSGICQMVSRNGHPFASFQALAGSIGSALRSTTRSAVIDGEIVCLDATGHPRFNDLLFHRAEPCFLAFDLIATDGRDLRGVPLIRRKAILNQLLRGVSSSFGILAAGCIENSGVALFEQVCAMDLEGVVAKLKTGTYVAERERSTWFKVRNPRYSQILGREELFERDRHREPAPGWQACDLACVEAEALPAFEPEH